MARLVGRVTRKSSTRSLRISESRKLLYLKVVNTPQIPKLDPWQSNHYHPISKEGEGEGEEGGDQKQEVESSSSLQNFLLHHIHQLQQQQQQQPPVPNKKPSRLPAHGGRIVRSTGRKDRHSKVSTAKGLRDRRVRLAAHTAIKFYDVQDRLGYDRPSKAVDWLIKNAKSAIDQLAELPPWNPETVTTSTTQDDHLVQVQEQVQQNNAHNQQNFLLFPDDHYNPPDLLSRTSSSHVQDLRLSLQSFQESATPPTQSLFSASSNLAFDANSVMPWNTTSDGSMFMSQFYTQREPLQSSNDPVGHQLLHPSIFHLTSSSSSPIIGGAFSGYRIPEKNQKQRKDTAPSSPLCFPCGVRTARSRTQSEFGPGPNLAFVAARRRRCCPRDPNPPFRDTPELREWATQRHHSRNCLNRPRLSQQQQQQLLPPMRNQRRRFAVLAPKQRSREMSA